MTRPQDVRLAVELGVDYIGLVLARSARQLSIAQARALRELIPDSIGAVALVMDPSAAELAAIAEQVRPDLIQFHGQEDDAACAAAGLPFLKALPMGAGLQAEAAMPAFPSAWGFVLDSHAPGARRQRQDLRLVPLSAQGRQALPVGRRPDRRDRRGSHCRRPALGRGRLRRIESAPGHKDPEAMRRFVAAVRAA